MSCIADLFGPPARTRFVDVHTALPTDHQDGSIFAPYAKLQDAIDDIEENIDTSTAPAMIQAAGGRYPENLVICEATALVIEGIGRSKIVNVDPDSGVALTVTNATKASLATFRSTGDYSDLVNNGAGPQDLCFQNVYFHGNGAASNHSIELLGVAGDQPNNKSAFLSGRGPCYQGAMFFNASFDRTLFARNAGYPYFAHSYIGAFELRNCAYPGFERCVPNNDYVVNVLEYVTGHDDGEPVDGNFGAFFERVYLEAGLQVKGESFIGWDGWPWQLDVLADLNFEDDSYAYLRRPYVHGDLVATGAVELTFYDEHIQGDLDLAQGSGAIVFYGGRYMGDKTDPSSRLTHHQGEIGS